MIFWNYESGYERNLDLVHRTLKQLMRRIEYMTVEMDRLIAVVEKNKTVSDSIVLLVEGLAQQLRDAIANGANPAELTRLADEIEASADREAAAVVANTPQEPQ